MKRTAATLAVVSLLAPGLWSTARATKPEGPVTILAISDFSAWPVIVATFEVVEGADLLGCSGGTTWDNVPGEHKGIVNNPPPGMSCIVQSDCYCGRDPDENGPDFTLKINPNPTTPGPGDLNGTWVIWKGSGDFAGLRGQGEVSVWFDFEHLQLFSIYTGTVHREP
jgi:hypothetical protein